MPRKATPAKAPRTYDRPYFKSRLTQNGTLCLYGQECVYLGSLADMGLPIHRLEISNAQMPDADAWLRHLGAFTDLTSLSLGSIDQMTDAGLVHLSRLSNLESLTLNHLRM